MEDNSTLESCKINWNLIELPRDREDLWNVKILPSLDCYVSSINYNITKGLDVKYSRITAHGIKDGKLIEYPFPEDALQQLVDFTKAEQDVHLYGLSKTGEIMSDLEIHIDSKLYLISNSDEFVVVRFKPMYHTLKMKTE